MDLQHRGVGRSKYLVGTFEKKLKEIFKIKRENSKVKIKSEKWKFCQNLMGTSPHVPQMFRLPSFIKTKTKLKTTKKLSIAKIAVEKKKTLVLLNEQRKQNKIQT